MPGTHLTYKDFECKNELASGITPMSIGNELFLSFNYKEDLIAVVRALESSRDFTMAKVAVERLLFHFPACSLGYALRGRILVKLGLVKEGLTEIRRGLALDNGDLESATIAAGVLADCGQTKDALEVLREIARVHPSSAEPAALAAAISSTQVVVPAVK